MTDAAGGTDPEFVPGEATPTVDLARMRQEYETTGIDESQLPAAPLPLFERWLEVATAAGLPEPNAMVVATVDREGQPWARTVLLKGITDGAFEFYTNYGSAKSAHLDANPRVSLAFVWIPLRRQVTITGTAARVSAETSDRYWAVRPRGSQLGGWASNQSRPLTERQALLDAYARYERQFEALDDVPRPAHWGGWAVQPRTMEFWQGRTNRLHDRFRYTLSDDDPVGESGPVLTWHRTRLAP